MNEFGASSSSFCMESVPICHGGLGNSLLQFSLQGHQEAFILPCPSIFDTTPRRRHHHCHASQIGGCNRRERRGGTWGTAGKVRFCSRRQCKDPTQMHPGPCRRPACCRARHVFASSTVALRASVLLLSAPSSPQHMEARFANLQWQVGR